MSVNDEINAIALREKSLETQLVELQSQYPDVFKQIKSIEDAQAEVQKLKNAIKEKLVFEKDFDLHEVGDLRVKLSAVAKVKVVDMDSVPDEFKETKTILKEKKAQEYMKVMGEPPAGIEDASYYRLNWKINSKDEGEE